MNCIIAVFIVLAICSKSSFFYPINNWGDAHCYYILGRGILNGMVPFKDLAEQKGPVIFFLYAIGELVSKRTFLGIFLIEVICGSIFIYYSLKIIGLFCNGYKYSYYLGLILAMATYSSLIFRHGGGPEELSICLFSYMLFLGTRYIEKNILPSSKEMIILGICAGLVFWTKYTLCIIFIMVLLFMLFNAISNNEVKLFWKSIGWFVAGCVLISIPILLYFFFNDALKDLFTYYFYNNIFLYKTNDKIYTSGMQSIIKATKRFMHLRNIFTSMLLCLGWLWLLIQKRIKLFCMIFISFIVSFLVINSGVVQKYGSLPLFCFACYGLIPIVLLLEKINFKSNIFWLMLHTVGCVAISYIFCLHTYDFLRSKNECPQYVFADEMKKISGEDFSLLYYGTLDTGFYFGADYLPEWKAFDRLNLGGNELLDLQNSYVNDRLPDYIVSEKTLCDYSEYEKVYSEYGVNADQMVVPFDDFGYEPIDDMHYFFEEYDHVVILYKKVS